MKMRTPTPASELYRWHRDALDGLNPPITETAHCGWYRRKFVRGGPWVPARVWMEQPTDDEGYLTDDEVLRCEVNGKPRDPEEEFSWLANNPITEAEFRHLTDQRRWADANRREDAQTPYDFSKLDPEF